MHNDEDPAAWIQESYCFVLEKAAGIGNGISLQTTSSYDKEADRG